MKPYTYAHIATVFTLRILLNCQSRDSQTFFFKSQENTTIKSKKTSAYYVYIMYK